MAIKLGINGLGRIGRTVLKQAILRPEAGIEVVAVNNPGSVDQFIHLLKYDSVHGKFPGEVRTEGSDLVINGKLIKFYAEKDPSVIPWSDVKVDIVADSTGIFTNLEGLSKHLKGTVKKVILCAPGTDVHGTFVYGINTDKYDHATHHIISNASCTTNCLAPVAKVINDKWGIVNGMMTTVHSYTSDQMLLDGAHKDPRRARAAALSIVPSTTGAAKAMGLVIPDLKGKLDGYAVRVPTPNVSLVDVTFTLSKPATKEEVNAALKEAAAGPLKGVLDFTTEELVSIDFMSNPHSSTVDSKLTNVIQNTVKVVAWYDNEFGFSNRVIDMAKMMGSKF